MKKKNPDGIPLESLFSNDHFRRHAEFLFHYEGQDATDPRLKLAILAELVRNAGDNVKKKERLRKQSKIAGDETRRRKKQANEPKYKKIAADARRLLQRGHEKRELSATLATKYGLSSGRIRSILYEQRVLQKKQK